MQGQHQTDFVEYWFVMTVPVLPLLEVCIISSGEIIGQRREGRLQNGRTVEKQRIKHVLVEDALQKKSEKEQKVAWITNSLVQLGFVQAICSPA